MRSRTLQRILQLQAEDGSFVSVGEWARPEQSPAPGRLAVLSNDLEYVADPGGLVKKISDREYVVVATGMRLIDTTEDE